MAKTVAHLTVVPRTDTASPLTADMVKVTAEFFVAEGYAPQDIPLFTRNRAGAARVMEIMAVLEAPRP